MACAFYLREAETKDEYMGAFREAKLKIDRDEVLLTTLQTLLLQIRSNDNGSSLYLEHVPIASELQEFVDHAFLSINERCLDFGFELQAILDQDR